MATRAELLDIAKQAIAEGDDVTAHAAMDAAEKLSQNITTASDVPVLDAPPTNQLIPATPKPEPSFLDKVVGAGEAGAGLFLGGIPAIGGHIAGTLRGAGGAALGAVTGNDYNNGKTTEQFASDYSQNAAAPFMPITPVGQEYMSKIGGALGSLDPAMAGFIPRGGALLAESKPLTAIKNSVIKNAPEASDMWRSNAVPPSAKDINIAGKILSGSTESKLAPYELKVANPTLLDSDGNLLPQAYSVVKNDKAKAAISQGWEDGTVQNLKTMDKQTTNVASGMLDVAEKSRNDKVYRDRNSPTDLIGEALEQNINFLKKKNTESGQAINDIANNFPKEPMDVSAPINKFIKELEDKADIKFARDENGDVVIGKNGKIIPDYEGSILEGELYKGDRDFLQKTLNRLTDTGAPTPLNVHRAKRYIDDSVTWGKGNQSTVRPEIERAAKGLRVGLDDALDNNFPEYNNANVQYRDTVTALDGLQDAAGKKLDFFAEGANQQLGTLSKRLMKDVTTRQELQNAITKLQDTSVKYGNPNKVDINRLGSFGADIEKIYKNSRPYSLQAQTAAPVVAAMHGNPSAIVGAAGAAKDFVMRVTPEKQYKTLNELLVQQKIKHAKAEAKQSTKTEMVTQ